jgi:meso-butanediol dehydrogenase / (S,S)-butanediol dehydrogenase / diacetyl reductase
MGRLEGRTAIVTGGGSGIGRATALALAREGAAVLVADRDAGAAAETCSAIADSGGRAAPATCDVADEPSVEAMFAVADGFGQVDILINNAGVGAGGDALNTTVDEWDRTLGVNVKGVWLCSRALLRRVLEAGRPAVIVNTSSTNAFYAEPGSAAYTASKGAVSALTRSLALDYARHGVRVNCVCPGIIDTSMTRPMLAAQPDPEATRRHWDSLHAIGRMGRPEDIAETIVFLATDEARFMAGSELVVDGGLSIGTRIFPEEG